MYTTVPKQTLTTETGVLLAADLVRSPMVKNALEQEIHLLKGALLTRGGTSHSACPTVQYYSSSMIANDSAQSGAEPMPLPGIEADAKPTLEVGKPTSRHGAKWMIDVIDMVFFSISQYNLWSIGVMYPVAVIPITMASLWSALMFFNVALWGAGIFPFALLVEGAIAAIKYVLSWAGATAGTVIVSGLLIYLAMFLTTGFLAVLRMGGRRFLRLPPKLFSLRVRKIFAPSAPALTPSVDTPHPTNVEIPRDSSSARESRLYLRRVAKLRMGFLPPRDQDLLRHR